MKRADAERIIAEQVDDPTRIDRLNIDPEVKELIRNALGDTLMVAIWFSGLSVGIEQGRSEVEWGSC